MIVKDKDISDENVDYEIEYCTKYKIISGLQVLSTSRLKFNRNELSKN